MSIDQTEPRRGHRAARVLAIGSIGLLTLLALLVSLRLSGASDEAAALAVAQAEAWPGDVSARPHHRPLVREPRPRATTPTAPPARPGPPIPTVFPVSLDEVPMTEWRRAQLARYDEQELELFNYKLGLMSDLRRCLSGRRPSQGTVDVFLHYEVDPFTGFANGTTVDLHDSTLRQEDDADVLRCISSAHRGRPMRMVNPGPEQRAFHWATEIALPVERDRAYLFFVK